MNKDMDVRIEHVYYAYCMPSCGWKSEPLHSQGEAENEADWHAKSCWYIRDDS